METYKSRYSAKDLDDTIGLVHGLVVPHIGDNGNWYVGTTDTGVYAGGVDVTGAEVGQTIKVSAVDENGVPTAWEAVEFPRGVRLENIYSITFDGSVMSACDDLPEIEDGSVYVISTSAPSGTAAVNTPQLNVRFGTKSENTAEGLIVASIAGQAAWTEKYCVAMVTRIGSQLRMISSIEHTTYNRVLASNSSLGVGNKIYIYSSTAGTNILANTKVTVYKYV